MIATKPFILYTLPKSRTTQAFLQGNKIEKIWHDLESFLNNCTTTSINKPSTATLTVYTAYEGDKHPELAKQILSESQAVFGKGKKVSMGTVPDYTIWQIKDEDLLKAVEYLQKGQPWPKSAFGPVELYVAYDFKLIDPDTGIELPNQEHTSMMLVWLSKRCSCSADLWFPFSEANKDFEAYLKKVEKYSPFAVERKYLKYGKPNKQGTAHIFKKLYAEENT